MQGKKPSIAEISFEKEREGTERSRKIGDRRTRQFGRGEIVKKKTREKMMSF